MQAVRCTSGCTFCALCITSQANLIMSQGKTTVDCDNCSAPIAQFELERSVPFKVLERLANLHKRNQLRQAGTESAECPCVSILAWPD